MIPKQAGLLRKAQRSVDAARLLSDEGHADFAASRAYYAMFYVAEALLLEHGLAFSKHSAVHAAFGQHFAKTGIVSPDLHRTLLDAARVRTVGDYDIGPDVPGEKTRELIRHAEQFLQVAEQLLGPISPTAT